MDKARNIEVNWGIIGMSLFLKGLMDHGKLNRDTKLKT